MPTLNWAGKDKVVNHHLEAPMRVLRRKWAFGEGGEGNYVIHGDNLEALKALLPRFAGKVQCIYIDPPYNTGNEGWVYNDNVSDPRLRRWLGQVVGKEGEDFSRHDKWLCMMYPRLRLLKKLMAEDGVLVISIGFQELPNLWQICAELFASRQITLVTVQTSGGKPSGGFNQQGEYLLVVAPKKFFPNPAPKATNLSAYHGMNLATFNQVQRPNQTYPIFINEQGQLVRVGKSLKELVVSGEYTGELKDFVFDYDNVPEGESVVWPVSDKGFPCVWRLQPTRFVSDYQKGYIKILPSKKKKSNNRYSIQYLAEGIIKKVESGELRVVRPYEGVPTVEIENYTAGGTTIDTIFTDKSYYTAKGKEDMIAIFGDKEVFSYPKPTELLVDILSRVMGKNALVLDSFAGSGTTAHAVLKLNSEDGGRRRFILVESMDYAEGVTAERVKRVVEGYGEGERRVAGTGGGFGFWELGPELVAGGALNGALGVEELREWVWEAETRGEWGPVAAGGGDGGKYYLGEAEGRAVYFCHEPGRETWLDRDLLGMLKRRAAGYVVYADGCRLDGEELGRLGIAFKKVPRDLPGIGGEG